MTKRYVIIRSVNAGCFAGYLKTQSADGKRVVLRRARRLWNWEGAASLSELAVHGTAKPKQCKFPTEQPRVELTEVVEISDCTTKGRQSIQKVPVWTARETNTPKEKKRRS